MSFTPRHRRSFFSWPRDYFRRRQMQRRVSNAILISLVSVAVAYVITRPTGGSGFSMPKSAQIAAGPVSSSTDANVTPDTPAPLESPAASPVSGAYKLADGPLTVTEVPDIVLHDAKRNKDLHMRIFYPNDAGSYPIIVFSHGAGGSQICCESLTRHWATYGYVTLLPTHDDSILQRRDSGEEEIDFLKAVRDAVKNPTVWENRPEDISFVLDSLPSLQDGAPALYRKMDRNHIGVGGHSMGASTADALAGALVDLPGHPATNFADSRVKAVLLLSPQGPGEFGLTDHSWDHVTLPLMSMTGSLDSGANGQGPNWKKIPFERSQPGDKYHVFIEGASHMSFIVARTLMPVRAREGEAILGYSNAASLAFWDAYLKADTAAKDYLRSNALPDDSHGAVKLFRR